MFKFAHHGKLAILVSLIGLSTGLLLSKTSLVLADTTPQVTICHRTNAVNNPYVRITVDADAADGDTGNDNGQGDHSEHIGPVATSVAVAQALKDNETNWGDIIPPHDNFAGLNWSTDGQAVYENSCNYPDEEDTSDDDLSCEETETCDESEPTPTPTPSATPDPSPTPTPVVTTNTPSGHNTRLANDNLACDKKEFAVVLDIFDGSNPIKDVVVTFTYNGATHQATSNENGRARTSFDRQNGGTVTAMAQDYPSQNMQIADMKCAEVATNPGQVLGVSTLASTGRTSQFLALGAFLSGIFLASLALYGYKQTQ